MECLFGITGKGFAIIASDGNAARSIVKMKTDEDKQRVLSQSLVMAFSGESGALRVHEPYGLRQWCSDAHFPSMCKGLSTNKCR